MKNRSFWILTVITLIATILRFYQIESNPPGLYWDETAYGYDAYSLLKTGSDLHGHFLPLFFESFGDWKLPVYFYLLVPSIALFSLSEFAVRFPSAFFGVLTVPLVFFLVKKLTDNKNLSLWSAFFMAISPWNIQFARGGFESTPGLFFVLLALFLFLLAKERKKLVFFVTSFVFFALSMYTYHAYRVFTPLLLISSLFIYRKEVKKNLKKTAIALTVFLILSLPLASFTFTSEGKSRAISQSAFKKEDYQKAKFEYDQKSKKPLRFLSGYIFTEPVYYSYVALKGYLDHFSPVFLFFQGDQIGRHSQVDMGQLYSYQIIVIAGGLLLFKSLPGKSKWLIIIFLLLSPIPAIIVAPTPHAHRTLQMTFPLALLTALGAQKLFSLKSRLLKVAFMLLMAFSFLSFLHLMFIHYPRKFAADWQIGYKEMVKQVEKFQDGYDKVYITNINQVPYIYVLFFEKYSPKTFIDEKGSGDHFNKYYFIDPGEDIYNKGRILYIAPSWQKVDGKWLAAVNDNSGKHLYSLWEVGSEK